MFMKMSKYALLAIAIIHLVAAMAYCGYGAGFARQFSLAVRDSEAVDAKQKKWEARTINETDIMKLRQDALDACKAAATEARYNVLFSGHMRDFAFCSFGVGLGTSLLACIGLWKLPSNGKASKGSGEDLTRRVM
jgi:hypothetical protein